MQQHPAYGATCRKWGRDVLFLTLGPRKRPVASAQILVRRWPGLGRIALLSRGPIWHDAAMEPAARVRGLDTLLTQLKTTHRGIIATTDRDVNGRDPMQARGLLQMMTPMHVAEWDLAGDAASRRAALHGKWRNRLVRAEDAGLAVSITALPPDPRHWLLRQEAAQARARRYRRLPPDFAAAWAASNPDGAWVFAAMLDGKPIAAILVLLHPPSASYHIGWASDTGRALSATNLLLWRAAEWLAARGITRLDLESVETEEAPGLARFKLGTSAKLVSLGSTWIDAPGTRLVARLAGQGKDRSGPDLGPSAMPDRSRTAA